MTKAIHWLIRRCCNGNVCAVNGFMTGVLVTLLVCAFVGPLVGFVIALLVNARLWWEERRP